MWWIIVAVVAASLVVTVLTLARRRRAGDAVADVDPMFPAGIALAGASAALVTTVGPAAFATMAVGLAMMVVGLSRTRSP